MNIIAKYLRSKPYTLLAAACILVPASVLSQTTEVDSSPTGENASFQTSIVTRGVLVKEGDTLASIARKELGRAAFAALLAEFNNIPITQDPNVGSVVRIPIPAPQSDEFAEVVFVKGGATLSRRSVFSAQSGSPDTDLDSQELTRDSKIVAGDLISTENDGYVSIAFFSGAVINLQPNTRAVLAKLACMDADDRCLIEINTQSGRVTADINARDQQPLEFKIITPYASAAVRGTMFDISANENLLVGVTEGAVAIDAQGENTDLDIGFGVAVAADTAAGDPIELSPAPVFKRIPARMALGDTLEWWEIYGSSTYEATVSNDEAAQQTLTTFNVADNGTSLDLQQALNQTLDSGDYFLSVRAVDTVGLLGFRSKTRITLADIDPAIEPVKTDITRDGGGFVVTVVDPPEGVAGYEIQISADATFSDPLSVDVNEDGAAIFRIDQDQAYSRARILVNPTTVSAFGEITAN